FAHCQGNVQRPGTVSLHCTWHCVWRRSTTGLTSMSRRCAMGGKARQGSTGLARLLAMAVASAGLAGCAMSERGPDSNGFVQQVRSVLGEQAQREVAVSQLVDARWEQLCMHRDGS